MKKWIILSLAFIPSLAFAGSKDKFFPLLDFSKGINSYYSSLTIADNEVKDGLNVFFDKNNAVVKRTGFTLYGSTTAGAFTGAWHYTDSSNTRWIIVRTSTAIYASPSNGLFTTRIATVSAANLVSEVNAQGSAYFVDRTNKVYAWNGTTTTYASGSPAGSLIAEFHGRIWVSGALTPNQNVVYGSKYLDGTTWALGSFTTDPVQITVGLSDTDDSVSGLYSGLNDILYIFKRNSINGIYGFDQSDFAARILTRDAGCIDSGTIQSYKGTLTFVSLRGIEMFDGVTSRRISDKIKDKTDALVQSAATTSSWSQTTQADFELGLSSPDLSTTLVPGSIINKTTSYALSSSTAVWSVPTSTFIPSYYADTITSAGNFQLTFPDEFTVFRSTLNAGTKPVWNHFGTGTHQVTATGGILDITAGVDEGGSSGIGGIVNLSSFTLGPAGTTFFFVTEKAPDAGFNLEGHLFYLSTSTRPSKFTTVPSPAMGIGLIDYGDGTGRYAHTGELISGNSYVGGTTITGASCVSTSHNYFSSTDTIVAEPHSFPYGTTEYFYITSSSYQVTAGTTTLAYGTHTCTINPLYAMLYSVGASRRILTNRFGVFPTSFTANAGTSGQDTGITSPIWGTFTESAIAGSSSTYTSQVSADNISFDAAVPLNSGSAIASLPKRYVKFNSTSTYAASSLLTPATPFAYGGSSVSFTAGSSGTFISQVHNAPALNAWSPFSATFVNNAGSNSFFIRAATGSFTALSTAPFWAPLTSGAVPTSSTGTFFEIRDDISGAAATPVQLQDFTVSWNEGNPRPPMASIVYDERYFLAVTTNSADSGNDCVIVLSYKDQPIWSLFDMDVGSFINDGNNIIYHGDSNATGKFYLDNQGYNDNGTAINAYIQTKDFPLEGIIYDKLFEDLYVESDALGAYSLTTSYNLDRSTNSYSLDAITQNEMPGFISLDLPFNQGVSKPVIGRTISFTFGNNGLDQPMTLYGGILNYHQKQEIRNLGR